MTSEHQQQATTERRTFVTTAIAAAAGIFGALITKLKSAEAGHSARTVWRRGYPPRPRSPG